MSSSTNDIPALAAACQSGDRRAASRLISLLESSDTALAAAASDAVSRMSLPRQTIGLTGPPGAGKSTLVDYLAGLYRARGGKVAVLAVDPSSPFTGGALLGDRIRMSSLRNDPGVFIRSMGSRGAAGGLASAASDALRVLGSAGYSTVLLETVGAGQAETEVVNLADTVCVIQVPGLGDDVQLMKMGLLEIADVFVVNKGDKPEAQELKLQIELALQTHPGEHCRALRQLGNAFKASFSGTKWDPPVVVVSALHRTQGDQLLDACDKHLAFLRQPALDQALKRSRLQHEIVWRAGARVQDSLNQQLSAGGALAHVLEACVIGKLSLDQAVAQVLKGG
jgi:LAO/AO transport system kinase